MSLEELRRRYEGGSKGREGKTGKHRKSRRKERIGMGNVTVVDEDGGFDVTAPIDDVEDKWDQLHLGKEERPVVVAAEDIFREQQKQEAEARKQRMADATKWTSVDEQGGSGGAGHASPPRRRRHDSDDDASPPRRRRHDSDDDASPPRRSQPSKSRSPRSSDGKQPPSSDSAAVAAAAAEASPRKRQRMSTGETAGLHSGASFRQEQERVRREEAERLKGVDDRELGRGADTVVRDRKGRKLDMLTAFMKSELVRQGKLTAEDAAAQEYEWGTGRADKERAKERAQELAELAAAPLAQYVNDPRRDAMLRDRVRDGDPMAAFLVKKSRKRGRDGERGEQAAEPARPVYKGPPPPPTRFGHIQPGYRWDGADRSNGFEARWLKARAEENARKEHAYRWSVTEM